MAAIGAIMGDICGSRFEFSRDIDWENCQLFDEKRCEFTDDTVLTLAVKDAVIHKKDFSKTIRKWAKLYHNAGYGSGFLNWVDSTNPKPYNSFGNGSAMRVSAIPDFYKALTDVQAAAEASAAVTHNHPEGIKGAVVTATCIWMAKHGKRKEDIAEYVRESYPPGQYKYHVGMPVSWLREHATWDVTCQGSVPVAVRCFLEAHDFESFMRNIFSIECDRDTLGAIGGGIVEEYYNGLGFDPEPLLEKYLDERLLYMANLPCKKRNILEGVYDSIITG